VADGSGQTFIFTARRPVLTVEARIALAMTQNLREQELRLKQMEKATPKARRSYLVRCGGCSRRPGSFEK
jgi:hypothetical protein